MAKLSQASAMPTFVHAEFIFKHLHLTTLLSLLFQILDYQNQIEIIVIWLYI